MTIELKPNGNKCNLACTYCYQEPMRQAGNTSTDKGYDLELMLQKADEREEKEGYCVFGGESLLVPIKDLETIFERSYRKYGKAAIQTNATIVNDSHIELFKKYNVHVGTSIDGHGELNILRSNLKQTELTMRNIQRMKKAGVDVGVICTIHKANASKEKLKDFIDFIRWLESIDIKNGIIHLLEVDTLSASLHALNEEETKDALLSLCHFFEENPHLGWNPFGEVQTLLQGNISSASCIWASCDPLNTQAVYGIEGNGSLSNCGMVNKEGIEWVKAKDSSCMRDFILYHTPQEMNGCQGCRFFVMCNGYCTGAAIDNDWRNRTYHCKAIKAMFSFYENKLKNNGSNPISLSKNLKDLEAEYLESVSRGYRPNLRRGR